MARREGGALAWLCFAAQLLITQAVQYTINDAPTIPNAHTVQFFYLEAPFPYNAPEYITNAAGSNYNRYGVGHAGLGIWDTTSDDKYSIEFVSNSYTGSLLPNTTGQTLTWDNSASVVVNYPLNENHWLNARLIATTSANAYTQLITYLQGSTSRYEIYQPVSIVYVNSSRFNASEGDVSNTDISSIGSLLIEATNSFAFVDDLINQLSTYGIDLGAFLPIYATSFNYFSESNVAPSVVSWNTAVANPAVVSWFKELDSCYSDIFQQTKDNGQGALFFLNALKDCYQDFAYVYASPNSVYNVSLGNYSDTYRSPYQAQYAYNLPPSNTGNPETLSVSDYVIIALILVSIATCCGLALHRIFKKKMRRRVSFEGERLAERTVENIAETQEDHTYFHGKPYGKTFFGRITGAGRKSNPNNNVNFTESNNPMSSP